MKHINTKQKIGLVLLGATVISNPLTGQYINKGIDWAFTQMFLYGAWVTVAFAVYTVFLAGVYYAKMEKVSVPNKTAKTKKQKYIATS